MESTEAQLLLLFEPRLYVFMGVWALASVVETITGFGSTIICVTITAILYPIPLLVTVLVPVNVVLSTYIVARHGKNANVACLLGAGWARCFGRKVSSNHKGDKRVFADYLFGVLQLGLVGMGVGTVIFTFASVAALELGYGIFVVLFSVFELSKQVRARRIRAEDAVDDDSRSAAAVGRGAPAAERDADPARPAWEPGQSQGSVPMLHDPEGHSVQSISSGSPISPLDALDGVRSHPDADQYAEQGRYPASPTPTDDMLPKQKPLTPLQGAVWLFLGGVMQGMYASGGPMMVYYVSRVVKSKAEFRATLSSIWLTLNTIIMITHIATGRHSLETLVLVGLLLPTLLLGVVFGEWLHRIIPEDTFRLFVYVLLLIAGCALTVNTVLTMTCGGIAQCIAGGSGDPAAP